MICSIMSLDTNGWLNMLGLALYSLTRCKAAYCLYTESLADAGKIIEISGLDFQYRSSGWGFV